MRKKRPFDRSAIEILDEAMHLLRLAPAAALACYYLGSIPFVLGFLYFWADMSQSAFAAERCVPTALAMAFLYVWMQAWHAAFAGRLTAHLSGIPGVQWDWKRVLRVAVVQAAVKPSGLVVLPVSFVLTLPFAWCWAFYQNATVLGGESIRECFEKSAGQANLKPAQNVLIILILSAFGLLCFVNIFGAYAMIPSLLKTLLGVETVFTRSEGVGLFNTTALASILAITYLCVDPLNKAVYVLRCFYGKSIASGEDLKAEMGALEALDDAVPSVRSKRPVLPVVLGTILLFASASAEGAVETAPSRAATIAGERMPAGELDQAISKVLQEREFAWRMPRQEIKRGESQQNWVVRSVYWTVDLVKQWLHNLRKWLSKFYDWLRKLFPKNERSAEQSGGSIQGLATFLRAVFVLLIVAILGLLVFLFYRMWKQRYRETVVQAEPVQTVPDLEDETVVATQLPEDGWLKLARELTEQGNLRLALRAFYLACLAHLAQREFITVAKFKSNRDYEREVLRRARALPQLQSAFSENVFLFDCSWYGLHEVDDQRLRHFQENMERIRAC